MPLILQIDTATEHASICLSKNGQPLYSLECADQKNHGSFLQPAIQELMQMAALDLSELDAIAVSEGPGSYTGLRVGMASAKGLCYALQKPLICINTLQLMAFAAISTTDNANEFGFVPMIDARRMEVFTAIYNSQLQELAAPNALILDETSYVAMLNNMPLIFIGSGAPKFEKICQHPQALFLKIQHGATDMSELAYKAFNESAFANLAYSEPFYLKSFYSPESPEAKK